MLNTAAAEKARQRLGGETAQLKRAAVLEHAGTMQRNVGNAVAAALQSVQAAQAGGRMASHDPPSSRSDGSRQSLSNAHVESRAALQARVRSAAGAEASPAAKAAGRGAAGRSAQPSYSGVPPQPGRDKAPKKPTSSKSRSSHATVEADSAESRAAKAAQREAQREEMRRKIAQDRRRMASEKPAPLAVVFEPQAHPPPSTVHTDIEEEHAKLGGGGFAAAPSVPLTPGGRHVARYAAPQSPAQRAAREMRHFASDRESFETAQAVRPSSKGSPTLQVHRAPKEVLASSREEHSPDTESRRVARAQQREALAARREADSERIQRLRHAQEPPPARGLARPGAPSGVSVHDRGSSEVRLSFSPHQEQHDQPRSSKHEDSDDDDEGGEGGPSSSPAASELLAAEEQASAAKQELEYVSMLVDLHATLHATGAKGGLAGALKAAAAQGKVAEGAPAEDDEWLDTDSDAEDAELEADAEAIAQAMGALPGGAADAATPDKADRVGAGAQRPPRDRAARGNAAAHLVTAHGAPVNTGVRNLVEVRSSDTPMHKAESMRQWLEDELGFEKFLLAYDALANAPPGAAPDRVMTIIGHHEKAFDVLMELLAVEARLYSAAPSSSAAANVDGVAWAAGPPPSP